jgi:carboxy-cis,cis-muconate cyclase
MSFPESNDSSSGCGVWIVLTDDDDRAVSPEGGGGVRILEWNGWGTGGVKEVVGWLHPNAEPALGTEESEPATGERMAGGSHAVWLAI